MERGLGAGTGASVGLWELREVGRRTEGEGWGAAKGQGTGAVSVEGWHSGKGRRTAYVCCGRALQLSTTLRRQWWLVSSVACTCASRPQSLSCPHDRVCGSSARSYMPQVGHCNLTNNSTLMLCHAHKLLYCNTPHPHDMVILSIAIYGGEAGLPEGAATVHHRPSVVC